MKKIIYITIFITLFLISCKQITYKHDIAKSVELANKSQLIPLENLINIITNNDSAKQFIFVDIRNPKKFGEGRIPNAINIPIHNMYEYLNKSRIFCKQNDKIFLIYADDASLAEATVFLLNQMGVYNVIAVGGGYTFVYNNIINKFSPLSTLYYDEEPKYNYSEKFKELSNGNEQQTTNTTTVTAQPVVPIKQKKTTGLGGCG